MNQGDPANWLFVLLEGVFQWRGDFGGDTVVLPAKAGEVNGVYPFFQNEEVHGWWTSPYQGAPAKISCLAIT